MERLMNLKKMEANCSTSSSASNMSNLNYESALEDSSVSMYYSMNNTTLNADDTLEPETLKEDERREPVTVVKKMNIEKDHSKNINVFSPIGWEVSNIRRRSKKAFASTPLITTEKTTLKLNKNNASLADITMSNNSDNKITEQLENKGLSGFDMFLDQTMNNSVVCVNNEELQQNISMIKEKNGETSMVNKFNIIQLDDNKDDKENTIPSVSEDTTEKSMILNKDGGNIVRCLSHIPQNKVALFPL